MRPNHQCPYRPTQRAAAHTTRLSARKGEGRYSSMARDRCWSAGPSGAARCHRSALRYAPDRLACPACCACPALTCAARSTITQWHTSSGALLQQWDNYRKCLPDHGDSSLLHAGCSTAPQLLRRLCPTMGGMCSFAIVWACKGIDVPASLQRALTWREGRAYNNQTHILP